MTNHDLSGAKTLNPQGTIRRDPKLWRILFLSFLGLSFFLEFLEMFIYYFSEFKYLFDYEYFADLKYSIYQISQNVQERYNDNRIYLIVNIAAFLRLLAISFLFPIASRKNLYIVLTLIILPWKHLNFVGFGYRLDEFINSVCLPLIQALTLLYAYNILYINNKNSVNEKTKIFIHILGIACIGSLLVALWSYPFIFFYKTPIFLKSLFVELQLISFCFLLFGELFNGEKPASGEKINFNPINKHFIGGLIALGFSISVLHFWYLIINFFN